MWTDTTYSQAPGKHINSNVDQHSIPNLYSLRVKVIPHCLLALLTHSISRY